MDFTNISYDEYKQSPLYKEAVWLINEWQAKHENNKNKRYEPLDLSNLQLEWLPPLPSNLRELNCKNNHLTILPLLPEKLKVLYCDNNQLTTLPELPNTLHILFCGKNKLTTLPELPNTLQILFCSVNQLTSLPTLPNSLIELYCEDNQLTYLPFLPNIQKLRFTVIKRSNPFEELPNTLQYLDCEGIKPKPKKFNKFKGHEVETDTESDDEIIGSDSE